MLPADIGTILAYLGCLFKEDMIHANSLHAYVPVVCRRQIRASHDDPFAHTDVHDFLSAFRRGDDARDAHVHTKADFPADVIFQFHRIALEDISRSSLERDAAMTELLYILTWREGSIRTLQIEDVTVIRSGSSITITVRPRSFNGCPVRHATPTSLACHDQADGSNGRDIQLRYCDAATTTQSASASAWSSGGPSPPQTIFSALQSFCTTTGAPPPRHSYYASRSLRSGSVSALILLGVPGAVIKARGFWSSERIVNDVCFVARVVYSDALQLYFSGLSPPIAVALVTPSPTSPR